MNTLLKEDYSKGSKLKRQISAIYSLKGNNCKTSNEKQTKCCGGNVYFYISTILYHLQPIYLKIVKRKTTPDLSFCLLQKSLRILSTMEDRGRMFVLFFFFMSLLSTTMMTQSAEPWVRRLFCQRIMSSLTELLYTSVSYNKAYILSFRQSTDIYIKYPQNT